MNSGYKNCEVFKKVFIFFFFWGLFLKEMDDDVVLDNL